jgi:hypothetical protein
MINNSRKVRSSKNVCQSRLTVAYWLRILGSFGVMRVPSLAKSSHMSSCISRGRLFQPAMVTIKGKSTD